MKALAVIRFAELEYRRTYIRVFLVKDFSLENIRITRRPLGLQTESGLSSLLKSQLLQSTIAKRNKKII